MQRRWATRAIFSSGIVLALTAPFVSAQSETNATGEEACETEAVHGEGYGAYPGYAGTYGVDMPPTGMDQIRQHPHPAPQWAATHAYPNYDYPDRFFGIWFRSQAWGVTKRERCAIPDPWRPRGKGNLFARPTTPHRMDYNREVIIDATNGYGPSYYLREPDPRCCVRTVDGHFYYRKSRRQEAELQERLDEATQVRIR